MKQSVESEPVFEDNEPSDVAKVIEKAYRVPIETVWSITSAIEKVMNDTNAYVKAMDNTREQEVQVEEEVSPALFEEVSVLFTKRCLLNQRCPIVAIMLPSIPTSSATLFPITAIVNTTRCTGTLLLHTTIRHDASGGDDTETPIRWETILRVWPAVMVEFITRTTTTGQRKPKDDQQ